MRIRFFLPARTKWTFGRFFPDVTNVLPQICRLVRAYVWSMVFGFSLPRISTGSSPMLPLTLGLSSLPDSQQLTSLPFMTSPLFLAFLAETPPRNIPVLALPGRHPLALVRLLPQRVKRVPPRTPPHDVAVLLESLIGQIPLLPSRPWAPILRIGEISALGMFVSFDPAL